MQTLLFDEKNIDFIKIKNLFEKGDVIAFPTETVYGIGALINQEKAILKIYQLKKRDKLKALTIHSSKISDVEKVAKDIPEDFYKLSKAFMPGPLTVILKKNKNISSSISPFDTIGFRVPDHPVFYQMLRHLDLPIVGTSANLSSEEDLKSGGDVCKLFNGKIACVIDAGFSQIQIPSTVISLVGEIKILRKGSISKEDIEKVLKKEISF